MKLGLQAMMAALAGMAGSFTGATKEARGYVYTVKPVKKG